ncbi:MAG: hypothetical protein KF841_06815 [Phycisphaerae bacterium]|nr:hypothetical protein [Phycisphaerae bacterium]
MGLMFAQEVSTVSSESRIELARWSADNALLIGGILSALAIYAVWWMYRREARGTLSKGMRWSLAAARVIVLLMLGLIGLEPVIVRYEHRRIDAQTIVLIDDSASMSLHDSYRNDADARRVVRVVGEIADDGILRSAVGERLLTSGSRGLLRLLAAENSVKLFSFGDSLTYRGEIRRATAQPDGGDAAAGSRRESLTSGALKLTAAEPATDVGAAIRGAVDACAGAPIAGIVLLTDGRFNHGEWTGNVGRFLAGRDIPLYAVGIGDPAEPVNARVVQIAAARSAFKNDPFDVTVRVDARGVNDQQIRLELFEQLDGKSRELVETRTLVPGADGKFAPAVFERKVKDPGTVRYIARIEPLAYESVTSDNERELSPAVRILDDQMRVLLIAGSPSYDYRFLSRMFERDPTVNLSSWLQSADSKAVRDGNSVITQLPETPEELNLYDAIIMMDCDPTEFGPTWGSLVAAYVSDYGGGLLYAAGNKFTGRFLKNENLRSLIETLPVAVDPEAELVINELGHYQSRAWPILIPDDAIGDPILRQSDSPLETRSIWSSLGQVYWHYPVRREKSVARVLMRHSNPRMANAFGQHVLFATQYVGTGRTAWLGINSTWRWRRANERHFNRFWIQTLRFLVEGKLLGGRARGQLLTTKEEFEQGETVVVTLRALDEQFKPLLVPELELEVSAASSRTTTPESERVNGAADSSLTSRTIELSPIVGREGFYEGRFAADSVGMHRLAVKLPGSIGGAASDADRTIEREITVSPSDIELRETALDRSAIQELVSAVGGRSGFYEVDETGSLPKLLPDMGRTFTVRGRPRPLWDNSTVMSVLVGLLLVEWALRKKARLL